MTGSVNKVILIGNLGKDPEVRVTQEGSKVISFTLATNERWRDKETGTRKDRTEWHRIIIFNERIIDFVEKYLKKGTKIYIEGQLQTRKWMDQSGQERYSTEVILPKYRGELTMLGKEGNEEYDFYNLPARPCSSARKLELNASECSDPLDDEIPF